MLQQRQAACAVEISRRGIPGPLLQAPLPRDPSTFQVFGATFPALSFAHGHMTERSPPQHRTGALGVHLDGPQQARS